MQQLHRVWLERFAQQALPFLANYCCQRGKPVEANELAWHLGITITTQVASVPQPAATCPGRIKSGARAGHLCGRKVPCYLHKDVVVSNGTASSNGAATPVSPTILLAPPVATVQNLSVPGLHVMPWREGYWIDLAEGFIVKPLDQSGKNYEVVGIARDRMSMTPLTKQDEIIAGHMGIPLATGASSTLQQLQSAPAMLPIPERKVSLQNGNGTGGTTVPLIQQANGHIPLSQPLQTINGVAMTVGPGQPTGQHFMTVLNGGSS